MKSKTRRTMMPLSMTKKKQIKKLKTSISPEMKDSSDKSRSESNNGMMEIDDPVTNKDNDSSSDDDYSSNKYANGNHNGNDSDSDNNYDSHSSNDVIIKKSKSKSKSKTKSKHTKLTLVKGRSASKSTTRTKGKNRAKEEKENRNTNNIQRIKDTSDDEKEYSDDKSAEESAEESEEEKKEKEVLFLPCRETEQKRIYDYIKDGLQTSGAYSSLYISGMPGTGKTASVLTVIKKLQYESSHLIPKAKKSTLTTTTGTTTIPPFNYLYINGMKIPNPTAVFKIIHNHIFSEKRNQNIKKYIQILDNFFLNREEFNYKTFLKDIKNSHLILIVDEVDCLINQKQNLLYNIFNWTTYNKSKLIVISISNTLDLPNRLNNKIQSRMGTNKLMFSAYVKDDLYKIISVKIEDVELFTVDALRYSCVKVAAINGDLRRMLLICRRAKELFFREKEMNKSMKKIDKRHIIQACRELFDSKLINVIQSLQLLEKLIIATILYRMKADDDVKIKVSDLYQKKDIFMNAIEYKMTWEEFTSIIFNLISLKIISFSEGFKENFVNNYVCIKFYTDEFMNAVEKDESFSKVLPLLQSLLNS